MFGAFLLGIFVGILWGFGWAYFTYISPLRDSNEELKKGIHDCIKSGMMGGNDV